LEERGYCWFRGGLSDAEVQQLEDAIRVSDRSPGLRLSVNALPANVLESLVFIAQSVLEHARPVRALYFDKSEDATWSLPWHRDLVVAVQRREETDGFQNWTQRDGIWQVRPPMSILRRMMFLRVLLDSTDAESGDLQLAVGSHKGAASETAHDFNPGDEDEIEQTFGQRGDVLAVKALVLHKSGTCQAGRRRAIRLDFSADDLPTPLKWAN
jgi:ectoine hydroxylase-related dioxygenase (phytanoyl-CoA dioxygenase family)